jgi:radical SAM protein with 4Fe4S-binding SPASM domain
MNSNGCLSANIMGGEFWLHSDWQNIIDSLSNNLKTVRLVTNGDFAEQKENYQPVIDFLNTHENIYLSISYDQYHTNKNYDNAIKICNEYNLPYTIPSDKIKNSTDWVLPVGNLDITDNIYSLFGCYCQNPEHRYSFLIDEDGNIFKCTFGIWKYANVKDYIEGGFRSKFKEFNKKFYNVFISNCKSCSTQYFFSRKD